MRTVRVGLVGFGNVGQALADLLEQRADVLYRRYHVDISVTGIATARHGTIIAPDGVDLPRTVAAIEDDPRRGCRARSRARSPCPPSSPPCPPTSSSN